MLMEEQPKHYVPTKRIEPTTPADHARRNNEKSIMAIEGIVGVTATRDNLVIAVEKRSQLKAIPNEIDGIKVQKIVRPPIIATTGTFTEAEIAKFNEPKKKSR